VILLQTVQSLYLIRPDPDGGQIPTPRIPRGQVRALRRLPTNQSGGGQVPQSEPCGSVVHRRFR